MKIEKIWDLIKRSEFVDLGFVDAKGMPNIRKVFTLWQYKSLSRHFMSTNTSSRHIQELLDNNKACLYYSDSETFEGLCLYGTVKVHFEREYKRFFWNDGDEKYYPKGVDDEDYCILEFVPETGQYYGGMGKYELDSQDINDKALGIEEFPIHK